MSQLTPSPPSPRDASQQFLAIVDQAQAALADPRVAAAWDEPSALAEYTVAGLAGHLVRGVTITQHYLAQPPATGPTRDAAGYFVAALGEEDPIDSQLHAYLRARSLKAAEQGIDMLMAELERARADLAATFETLDPAQPVEALGGIVLSAGDYVTTRLVELVVHLDDLAVSLGDEHGADLDPGAVEAVIATLAIMAARRGDPLAVVRSLARRERHPDAVRAL